MNQLMNKFWPELARVVPTVLYAFLFLLGIQTLFATFCKHFIGVP